DLWTNTWTPADINNSGFGVALSVESNLIFSTLTATVDYIQVTVSYTLNGVEWYVTSTGGTPVEIGTNPWNPVNDPQVTGAGAPYNNLTNTNTPGTYSFWVECNSVSECRTQVDFVIVSDPSITISGGATVCEDGSVTLTANPSGGTGTCTIQWQS